MANFEGRRWEITDAPERGALLIGHHPARKSYGLFLEVDGAVTPLAYFRNRARMDAFLNWLNGAEDKEPKEKT